MIRAKLHSLNTKFTIVLTGLLVIGLLGSVAVKAAGGSGSFALTGSLNTARYQPTATLLTNQRRGARKWGLGREFPPACRLSLVHRAASALHSRPSWFRFNGLVFNALVYR